MKIQCTLVEDGREPFDLAQEYVRRLQRTQLLVGLFCFHGKMSELGAQNIVIVSDCIRFFSIMIGWSVC